MNIHDVLEDDDFGPFQHLKKLMSDKGRIGP